MKNGYLLPGASLSGLRFLAIDDDPVSRELLAFRLKKCGARVDIAESSDRITNLLLSNSYYLVLLDIHMSGIDGFEIADIIRRSTGTLFKDIPIVALTSDILPETRRKMTEYKINDCVYKPIDFLELHSKLISILNLRSKALSTDVIKDRWRIPTEHINPSYLFTNYGSNKNEILRMLVKSASKLDEYTHSMLLAYRDKNDRELLYNAHKLVTVVEILGIKSIRLKLSEMQEFIILQKPMECVFTSIKFIDSVKQMAFKEVKDLIDHINQN